MNEAPYVTIRSRRPHGGDTESSFPSASTPRSATHDISRTSYHIKHISQFAQTLEDSAVRAFPNRGRTSQRYTKVHALLLHWSTDDLFVLPELEDLEKCLREDYAFETTIFAIPADNAHLELMMEVGKLIKEHESEDTLFMIYYGGHARIDESRQSRWCATRNPDSHWLQWSAIQTLLERSISDILILLDCCAGAASATFSTGTSITETISASSWDAIAPDPGRYSFTNALIEVLQEWRTRTFSAAMLHAEVLARLKHPRPIMINGKYFEARSTPVHFMMTSNHKAPSIEIARMLPSEPLPPRSDTSVGEPGSRRPGPLTTHDHGSSADSSCDETASAPGTPSTTAASMVSEPNENVPHVMISLALEEDQRLDINAWQSWLASFPALAKYVKVQGVFKSHSNLLLLSMPVMVWDLLPEDPATSFVAFIRSNNLAMQTHQQEPTRLRVRAPAPERRVEHYTPSERTFFDDNTTITPSEGPSLLRQYRSVADFSTALNQSAGSAFRSVRSARAPPPVPPRPSLPPAADTAGRDISRALIYNQHRSARRTTFGHLVPEPPNFATHIVQRLEHYFQRNSLPSDADREFIASNLGINTTHVEAWFHFRREQDVVRQQLGALKLDDRPPPTPSGPRMILPGHLNELLNLSLPPRQVLIVDLRAPSEFLKSRVRGAVNLRAPASFLRCAPPEALGLALADERSREVFAAWRGAGCVVLYARAAEAPWECPAAEALISRFVELGWGGEVCLLKGHYREFSASFGEHTESGKPADSDTRAAARKDLATAEEGYRRWLEQRRTEERASAGYFPPALSDEKREALERQEEQVEKEFKARCPELYGKALGMEGAGPPEQHGHWKGDAFGEGKARMVEHLDRGLSKMRDAAATQGLLPTATPPYDASDSHLKLPPGKEVYFEPPVYAGKDVPRRASYDDRVASEEYVEITKGDAVPSSNKPGYPVAGGTTGPPEQGRRGRGGGSLFSRVLRRT